jgi:acyl-CoA synthetase (AMP-forming)/AMP-acid ligase II
MLAHPGVAEAVSFAAPDEKYGEVVAAAVVLNEQGLSMGDAIGEAGVGGWLVGNRGVGGEKQRCWL